MVVIKTIKSYLHQNRRLVVPSFGCFIVKEPGTILFSELISSDDGILRGLLTSQGLSDIEAAAKIDRLIFEIRHSLINDGRCQIADFGIFTRATDGNIRFYADKVAFSPTAPQPQSAAKPKVAADATIKPTSPKPATDKPLPQQRAKVASQKQSGFGGFAIWFAIIVIVAALAAIAYGFYCELTIPDNIDAEMEAKRVEIVKESPNK